MICERTRGTYIRKKQKNPTRNDFLVQIGDVININRDENSKPPDPFSVPGCLLIGRTTAGSKFRNDRQNPRRWKGSEKRMRHTQKPKTLFSTPVFPSHSSALYFPPHPLLIFNVSIFSPHKAGIASYAIGPPPPPPNPRSPSSSPPIFFRPVYDHRSHFWGI